MKFLKLARAHAPPQDDAAAVRLHAIVGRGQAELSLYKSEPQPSAIDEPHTPTKRFWTPEEVAAANDPDREP